MTFSSSDWAGWLEIPALRGLSQEDHELGQHSKTCLKKIYEKK
jgi:hypothetical protein